MSAVPWYLQQDALVGTLDVLLRSADELQAYIDNPLVRSIRLPPRVWEVPPLYIARSNLTITIEAGAVLQARRDSVTGGESLINILGANTTRPSNINIVGVGDVGDTRSKIGFDPFDTYSSGEHRHAIKITNADNIRVSGLVIDRTFGDGIYVGDDGELDPDLRNCTNITLEDLQIYNTSRNAISIVSARHCRVSDILIDGVEPVVPGVASNGPQAGIDIEPNSDENSLTDIQIENITVRNCYRLGAGALNIELAHGRCTQDGGLADITVSNLDVENCPFAVRIVNAFDVLGGSISVTGLTAVTDYSPIFIRDKVFEGVSVSISGTVTGNRVHTTELEGSAPVVIAMQSASDFIRFLVQNGNVTLDVDALDNRAPYLAYIAGRSTTYRISNIFGAVRGRGSVFTSYVGYGIELADVPLDLVSYGNLDVWLRADSGLTLAGSNVATWADQSGNARDATEATNRPLYEATGAAGRPCVTFDGTNDKLTGTTPTASGTDVQYTVLMVASAVATGSGKNFAALVSSGSGNAYISHEMRGGQWTAEKDDDTDAFKTRTAGAVDTNRHLFVFVTDSTGILLNVYVDGVRTVTNGDWDVGAQTLGGYSLGCSKHAGTFLDFGNVRVETFALFGIALDSSQLDLVSGAVAEFYGITLA